MALTAKQQIFVREYVIDYNATRAAIAAGYSKDTARFTGPEYLSKPHIQAEIKEILDNRLNKLDITADRIAEEYAKLAFSDIGGFVDYKTVISKVGEVDEEDVYGYQTIIDVKDSQTVDTSAISEVSISKDGTFKFKLHDKKGALDSLSRIKGMFNDKIEHSGTVTIEQMLDDID